MSNQAQSRPTMEQVTVELGERSYPIYIGAGLLAHPELITGHLGPGRVVIITNDTVAPLYLEQARALFADRFAEAIVLADGEAHKNLDTVATIYDRLMAGKYDQQNRTGGAGRRCHRRYHRLCCRHLPTRHSVCADTHHLAGSGGLLGGRQDRSESCRR